MTEYEGYVCAPGDVGKIAIIVSRFNRSITDNLLAGALAKFRENMISEDQITVVYVPGAFEIPTIAQRFALDEDYAAVVCLGCVIKGETQHDEYINSAVSSELARIGAENGLPVVFGIITCNTVEQALARSGQAEICKDKTLGEQPGNKGAEAAEVALQMIDLIGKLPELELDSDEFSSGEFSSIARNSERYLRGDFETVDVDPDSLVEIDDDEEDEEEDENWFVRKDSSRSKPKERFNADGSKPRKGGDSFKKDRGSHGSPSGKGSNFGKSKFGGGARSKDNSRKRGGKSDDSRRRS